MGLLNFFCKAKEAPPLRWPSGSFTVDPHGAITATTLPGSFPLSVASEIADAVLATFQESRKVRLPLAELSLSYPGFRISARELGGGALVFLLPRNLGQR